MAIGLGLGREHVEASVVPRTLWIFYARATSEPEILYGREFTARGQPLGNPLRLGTLGLVQETQVATTGADGEVWVTLGRQVVGIQAGRVNKRITIESGDDMLSVRWLDNALYGVQENVTQSRIVIVRRRGNTWRSLDSHLPEGITTLESGPHHSIWVLSSDPHRATLKEVSGGHESVATPALVPQGTVGFHGNTPVIPFSRGDNEFGYYTGHLHRFRSVYEAAISVMNTVPLWGLSVKGLIPFTNRQFRFRHIVPWKEPLLTTPVVIGKGTPNVVILDGFSQGTWFNVQTGILGPKFQIKTPWWAVVRAAALGSYSRG